VNYNEDLQHEAQGEAQALTKTGENALQIFLRNSTISVLIDERKCFTKLLDLSRLEQGENT
jgi:hypothetical protein